MLTPATYGFGSRLSVAAFYWEGLNANGVKSTNAGTNIVEAGWLSGLGFSAPSGSNMPTPKVFVYSSPGGNAPSTRFTTPRFPNFVGLWGKSKAVFPTTLGTWQVFGPPANAT
jgi:hypothetical protein